MYYFTINAGIAHEGDLPLPVDEQLAIQKLLQRISIYPSTEPWLLPKTRTNVVGSSETWRNNLRFGDFVQLKLNGFQMLQADSSANNVQNIIAYCQGQVTAVTKDGQFLHILVYFNDTDTLQKLGRDKSNGFLRLTLSIGKIKTFFEERIGPLSSGAESCGSKSKSYRPKTKRSHWLLTLSIMKARKMRYPP